MEFFPLIEQRAVGTDERADPIGWATAEATNDECDLIFRLKQLIAASSEVQLAMRDKSLVIARRLKTCYGRISTGSKCLWLLTGSNTQLCRTVSDGVSVLLMDNYMLPFCVLQMVQSANGCSKYR